MFESNETYTVWADGACQPNPGEGGAGAIVIDSSNKILKKLSFYEKQSTNNRMEILSVALGLKHVPNDANVNIYSDSIYVVNTIKGTYKRKTNHDCWQILFKEINRLGSVRSNWVKGHDGNKFNEEADQLAAKAIINKCNETFHFD